VTSYAYTATGPDGRTVSGTKSAATREAAEFALHMADMTNIRVVEKKSILQFELFGSTVKREEIMHLSRQLSAFIRAGLPLIEAVHVLGEESGNKALQAMLHEIESGLRRGERLSDCLDRHPRAFPDFYRGILRSAELTGQLDTILDQLAKYLERDLEARRRIKAAMIYPMIVAGMSLITVVVLASFVLPRFKVFFASLNARLPLPTRMLLAVTGFISNWWWALLAGVVAVVVIWIAVMRTEGGRFARDRMILRLPLIGDTVRFALVERFCRVLASMAGAGVSLPQALRVASESLRNLVFTRSLAEVSDAMLNGEGLAVPLAGTGLFPSTAARMVRVGEETGTLDVQLDVIAKYYETELDYKLKNLTAAFEPAVIIFMGLIVGFVAIALISAMYGIFNSSGV
jgi:type IV pilus assembly protein PilC